MGKNLQKLFSFRTDDSIIEKLNFIAEYNTRTRNKEIEHVLKQHIKNFECNIGKLEIDEHTGKAYLVDSEFERMEAVENITDNNKDKAIKRA